jgi:hypothetical protein
MPADIYKSHVSSFTGRTLDRQSKSSITLSY